MSLSDRDLELAKKLLPCPFCGGTVSLEQTIDKRKWWGVVCRNTANLGGTCAIQQIPSATEEAAIQRWNTRATEQTQAERDQLAIKEKEDAVREALENALKPLADCYLPPEGYEHLGVTAHFKTEEIVAAKQAIRALIK